ncbi:hypothetical protein [Paenibacillus macerans]|uniref:hypothetical protein n=1 Tax=Paenibacillus macerans TaxID=44252 RepID=UPI003D31FBD2
MTFFKLNGLSAMYAIILFIQTEALVNEYRIARITGFSSTIIILSVVIICIGLSVLCYYIALNWFSKKNIRYLSSLLWIPYYYIFIKLNASLFPIINPRPYQELVY